MFVHIRRNNIFQLVTVDENGIAHGWELDHLGEQSQLKDEEIVVKYETDDIPTMLERLFAFECKIQDHDFSRNYRNINHEVTIKDQLEILKDVPRYELKEGAPGSIHDIGVQRFNNFITEEMADRLLEHINYKHATCIRERDIDPLPYGKHRDDLVLERIGVVDEVVTMMFPKFEEIVGKKIIGIEEIRALINKPGSTRQWVHEDSCVSNTYAFFVAPQDVTLMNGPTMFIPGTNKPEIIQRFYKEKCRGFPLKTPSLLATVKKGDAFIYSHRVLHCGTENVTNKNRVLFYMTCEVDE